jgi:hypothetical protein
LLAAGWGVARPLGAGHYGWTSCTIGIDAETMLKWGIPAPVGMYSATKPPPAAYYCNHPWGIEWAMVPFVWLFGHHNWTINFPAALVSGATIFLIFGLARQAWGPIPGMAAAFAFAVLPITLTYSNFHGLEIFVMFGWALFFWGHARMLATGRRRYLFASVLGVGIAGLSDWQGYIALALLLAWGLLRGFILPARFTPPVFKRRYVQWWALCVSVSFCTIALTLGFFYSAGKLTNWLSSEATRSEGGGWAAISTVLKARKSIIEATFTPWAIRLGKISLGVAFLRFLVHRRDEEAYSLASFAAAAFQYVHFKSAADVHVFWPHTFGFYFALSFAQLVATIVEGASFLLRSRRPALAELTSRSMGAVAALSVLVSLPDGMRGLVHGRATGGRFSAATRNTTDTDSIIVLQAVAKQWPADITVVGHSSMGWSRDHDWAVHRPSQVSNTIPEVRAGSEDKSPIFVLRRSGISLQDAQKVAATFHVRAYDDIWVVDRRLEPAPLDAFSLSEREPGPVEWYLYGGYEPMRRIVPDAYRTWNLRTDLGQPAVLPTDEPTTAEDLRIAHNMAVGSGDVAKRDALRGKIEALFEPSTGLEFSQGVRMVGRRRIGGVDPRFEVWFEAPGPLTCEAVFTFSATIVRRRRFSMVDWAPPVRDLTPPMASTKSWRPGFLYKTVANLFARPAVERYSGRWTCVDGGSPPVRTDGQQETELAVE